MTCKLAALLVDPELPEADRFTLGVWLDTGEDAERRPVSAAVLAAALSNAGHLIGSTTIKDHRASRCACTRRTAT